MDARVVKVKGSKLTAKFAYLKSRHGEASVGEALATMSAADQKALGLVLDVSWYPQDLYERLLKAIGATVGHGDEAVYTRIGEHSAEHQFSHIFRAYRAAELEETLRNMVPVHAKLNEPSGMQILLPGPGRATIVVSAPRSTPVICAVSRGFYRRTVELHGARDVEVRETTCSGRGEPVCRFEIRWSASA
jgi:V4R domain-containing protein